MFALISVMVLQQLEQSMGDEKNNNLHKTIKYCSLKHIKQEINLKTDKINCPTRSTSIIGYAF
jgi:hypothetical protein